MSYEDELDKFKPYNIGSYRIERPLSMQNGGCSKWGFCRKNGEEYFIKEFLSPVYPSTGLVEKSIYDQKVRNCDNWFRKQQNFYDRISRAQNGNLIAPIDFFRSKNHYYIVTQKVDGISVTEALKRGNLQRKLVLLKVLANSFDRLAKEGVVHADLKMDNIMIKPTSNGFFTVKIIDFDAGYIEGEPPLPDDIQGDAVYFAPETLLYITEEEAQLTPEVDVFAMGILFHQILTGKLPFIDKEYDCVAEAVLDDAPVSFDKSLSEDMADLIRNMLKKDPIDRLSADMVFLGLGQIENNTYKPKAFTAPPKVAVKEKKAAPPPRKAPPEPEITKEKPHTATRSDESKALADDDDEMFFSGSLLKIFDKAYDSTEKEDEHKLPKNSRLRIADSFD